MTVVAVAASGAVVAEEVGVEIVHPEVVSEEILIPGSVGEAVEVVSEVEIEDLEIGAVVEVSTEEVVVVVTAEEIAEVSVEEEAIEEDTMTVVDEAAARLLGK